MRYAMLLKPHPNVRYRQSLQKLALIELECILDAWHVTCDRPRMEYLANEPFLVFEAQELNEAAWAAISRHSAICLAAQLRDDGALQPVARACSGWLPEDLPHVLKYKGKTNADFTYLMLHCARAASAFAHEPGPLRILDPMCGKGTTLMCALCENCDAVGVDTDAKAIREAESYLERSLKLHRIKHRRASGALTLPDGKSARWSEYALAPDAQIMRTSPLSVRMIHGDAGGLDALIRPQSCHLAVCDLPYGVQHAPRENGAMSSLARLVERVLPGCVRALKPGGAVAFAFNLNTLRRAEVATHMESAGLEVMSQPPYDDFSHWVEQAVERDVVIARKA